MQKSLLKSGWRLVRFLTKLVERPTGVLILTHDYPDPDSLASAYALHFLLDQAFQIKSRIVYGGTIGRMENKAMVRLLKMPVHPLKTSDLKKFREIALVDTQPDFKNNSFPPSRKAFLVIDQHPMNKKPNADFAIIDTDCGATCVVLAEACLLLELDIPTPVATALAYGILSDTLNLYRVKRKDVIQTYLGILPHCDMRLLARIQNPPRAGYFFTTLAKGICNAEVRKKLIFSHLGFIENPDVVSQLADLLLTYQGTQFAFCTGRYQGRLHVSFRMQEATFQASDLLRDVLEDHGSAGGHETIAGGSLKVGNSAKEEIWSKLEIELIERLTKKLKIGKGEAATPFQI